MSKNAITEGDLKCILPVTVKELNSYKNTRDLQGMGTVVCENV